MSFTNSSPKADNVDFVSKILPVPPLEKEGTLSPPFVKPVLSFVEGGAARSARGFDNAMVNERWHTILDDPSFRRLLRDGHRADTTASLLAQLEDKE